MCGKKKKTFEQEWNSWNNQFMDTTESKTNLVNRNTFTIFLKRFIKLANPLKFSAVWKIFFVRSIFSNIFCFQRLCKKIIIRCTSDLFIQYIFMSNMLHWIYSVVLQRIVRPTGCKTSLVFLYIIEQNLINE